MPSRYSDTQRRIFLYIQKHISTHGWGPTYDEIRKGVGVVSKSTVSYHVEALVKNGYLAKLKGRSGTRAMRLTKNIWND